MNQTLEIAIITAAVTLTGTVLTAVIAWFRERSERQKWQRTIELEERRIKHEENKWVLDLNNQREMDLHKLRVSTYPEVFAALGNISSFSVDRMTRDDVLALAEKLNGAGYGAAGLCMLPDTRDAVFVLRDRLLWYSREGSHAPDIVLGPRVDLIELMRRDLNHNWSRWRDILPLTKIHKEEVDNILTRPVPSISNKDALASKEHVALH